MDGFFGTKRLTLIDEYNNHMVVDANWTYSSEPDVHRDFYTLGKVPNLKKVSIHHHWTKIWYIYIWWLALSLAMISQAPWSIFSLSCIRVLCCSLLPLLCRVSLTMFPKYYSLSLPASLFSCTSYEMWRTTKMSLLTYTVSVIVINGKIRGINLIEVS